MSRGSRGEDNGEVISVVVPSNFVSEPRFPPLTKPSPKLPSPIMWDFVSRHTLSSSSAGVSTSSDSSSGVGNSEDSNVPVSEKLYVSSRDGCTSGEESDGMDRTASECAC